MSDSTLFGIHIPAATILAINPLVIICCGTLATALLHRTSLGYALPFFLGSLAFGGLVLGCYFQGEGFPAGGVMGAIALISFAELMVGPIVYSQFAKNAPKGQEGMVMGLVPIGYSFASLLGGFFSKCMALDEGGSQIAQSVYGRGFGLIALVLLAAGTTIILITRNAARKSRDTVSL